MWHLLKVGQTKGAKIQIFIFLDFSTDLAYVIARVELKIGKN